MSSPTRDRHRRRRRPGRARDFGRFVAEAEPRLRRALVAAYGPEVGREATVDALAWAWVHWERVQGLDNPVGYLYRVGQSAAGDAHRRRVPVVAVAPAEADARSDLASPGPPWFEPGLEPALDGLTRPQRVAVVLCHGFQWTHREVADLLELSPSTVQNHVERGLAKLRSALEVSDV